MATQEIPPAAATTTTITSSSSTPPGDNHQSATAKLSTKTAELRDKAKSESTGPPGGFDPTPFPDAPAGFTVRFTFVSATNLPPADVRSYSSDPFVLASLRAPGLPRRHKEDPEMTHQTPTIRETTEPVWNDTWTVANVPATGFSLKCRLFDEDYPDKNDRLGHVMITVSSLGVRVDPGSAEKDMVGDGLGEDWKRGKELLVKKRTGSKRVYALRGCMSIVSRDVEITPRLTVAIEVLGVSDPPYAQMYTVGPSFFIKHYSPMIGRITGTKVNANEHDDVSRSDDEAQAQAKKSKTKKVQRYDFQANEMQLSGPVPAELYHRYVEFRPIIGAMFSRSGLAGRLLNNALHKQHSRVYNFDKSTERAEFEPRSREASLHFLRMAHFDEGSRLFTYVLTLDGMLRFTETGSEFGIDFLSKHAMHSDVAAYIAFSGEFFIHRVSGPSSSSSIPETHPNANASNPPLDPSCFSCYFDNASGSFRPNKAVLPQLRAFMEREFPGLGIVAMHWEDPELKRMKQAQVEAKRRDGRSVNMVLNRSPSSSSLSSGQSMLDHMEDEGAGRRRGRKARVERMVEALEHPKRIGAIMAAGGFVPAEGDDGVEPEVRGEGTQGGDAHKGEDVHKGKGKAKEGASTDTAV